jgi:hypothetical protein
VGHKNGRKCNNQKKKKRCPDSFIFRKKKIFGHLREMKTKRGGTGTQKNAMILQDDGTFLFGATKTRRHIVDIRIIIQNQRLLWQKFHAKMHGN